MSFQMMSSPKNSTSLSKHGVISCSITCRSHGSHSIDDSPLLCRTYLDERPARHSEATVSREDFRSAIGVAQLLIAGTSSPGCNSTRLGCDGLGAAAERPKRPHAADGASASLRSIV